MKSFFVGVGVLLAASLTTGAVLLAYAIVTAAVALILGGFVMVGFAIASSSSDGLIPAFGYITSSAITYTVLLPLGAFRSGMAKQKTS
jgi:hypothetical protein